MRVLVLASCLLAVASAGFLPAAYHGLGRVGVFDQNGYKIDDAPAAVAAPLALAAPVAYAAHYAGPHHLPVIGPNGVPLETPEVVAAKANHAAAHVEATVRNAAADGVAVVGHAAGVVGPLAYAAHHVPVIGPNGVPLDTPAVAVAKANHAAAHVEATARNAAAAVADGVAVVAPHGLIAHGYAAPVLAHGVPVDTPAVAAAKAAHFAAHVDAKVRAGILHPLVHYRKRRGIFHGVHHGAGLAVAGAPVVAAGRAAVYDQNGYQIDEAPVAVATPFGVAAPVAYAAHYAGPQHLPVIGPNGVPLDTPAVSAAKAGHAAAHVEASARNAAADVADSVEVVAATGGVVGGVVGGAFVGPVGRVYAGPQHLPVIGPNGVPVDTPAVTAAKVGHAAAHVEAVARNAAADVADSVEVLAAPAGAVVTASGAVLGGAFVGPVGRVYAGPQHLPVIGPNGVPLDTPEVAAGKVANAVAHAEANARNGDFIGAPIVHAAGVGPVVTAAGVAPLAYSAGYLAPVVTTHYAGPQHLPVIGPNGVPLDTPEVAAGKAANTAAHIEAKVRNGDLLVHY